MHKWSTKSPLTQADKGEDLFAPFLFSLCSCLSYIYAGVSVSVCFKCGSQRLAFSVFSSEARNLSCALFNLFYFIFETWFLTGT